MGFNTTILILNDALDQIRRNPDQFTDGIYHAILQGGRKPKNVPVGNHGNPVTVMQTAHADEFRLYATRGNAILELTPARGGAQAEEIMGRGESQRNYVIAMIEEAEKSIAELREKLGLEIVWR